MTPADLNILIQQGAATQKLSRDPLHQVGGVSRTRDYGRGLHVSQRPARAGIDIDEDKAKKLLVGDQVCAFYAAEDRRADGSVVRP